MLQTCVMQPTPPKCAKLPMLQKYVKQLTLQRCVMQMIDGKLLKQQTLQIHVTPLMLLIDVMLQRRQTLQMPQTYARQLRLQRHEKLLMHVMLQKYGTL